MSRIKVTAAGLGRFLDGVAAPIYVIDDDRRIVFCNSACAQWLGLKANELIGQQCGYHPPSEPLGAEAAAASLCPPPRAFSGHAVTAVVTHARADGRTACRRGHFMPLDEGHDESAAVVAVLEFADCSPESYENDGRADDQLHEQVRRFRQQMAGRFAADRLIGNNPLVVRARAQVELAAQSGTGALIVGPPGSGKDHAAKSIHYAQQEPGLLVPLDCAVVETNVLRSALRTLCVRRRLRPPHSTLLLEHIDCMPAEAQAELVEILRGDALHMRVVATSCKSLAELVANERFLHELACALSTLVIEMPPLTERLDDLPLLVQALVEETNAGGLRQIAGFTPEAIDQLAACSWPGNIDELASVVREARDKAAGCDVTPSDLPKPIQWSADAAGKSPRGDEAIVLEEFLARVEKELIARAMRRAKGNKSKAAKLLGLTRPRLYRRLVQLGLEQHDGHDSDSKG